MNDEIFTPERVDEQIEQDLAFSRPGQSAREPGARVAQRLHALYEEDVHSTVRVWERLVQQAHRQDIAAQSTEVMPSLSRELAPLEPQSTISVAQRQKKRASRASSFGRRISLLAAALVVAILVGSLAFVLHATRPSTSVVSSTPGQTVYSMTYNQSASPLQDVAWSPDSQRVALLTFDSLQIRDATTGANKVIAHLPADMLGTLSTESLPATGDSSYLSAHLPASGGGGPNIKVMAWSPDGKWIAVSGMGWELAIVNAQTGALAHQYTVTYSSGTAAERLPSAPGSTLLSAHMPASGAGRMISGLAWSSDSQQLAATVLDGGFCSLSILNVQTGTTVHHQTFGVGKGKPTWMGVASWSPDGKYLAASVYVDADQPQQIWVWDTSDYQIVFKQLGGSAGGGVFEQGDQLVWQPHTDNLTFVVIVGQLFTESSKASVELWNVAQNTRLQQYTVTTPGQLAWSPNGTYLASVAAQSPYAESGQWITVLNATNGQQVYNYRQHTHPNISGLAWSPDGKYIVSCDSTTVRVWVAP